MASDLPSAISGLRSSDGAVLSLSYASLTVEYVRDVPASYERYGPIVRVFSSESVEPASLPSFPYSGPPGACAPGLNSTIPLNLYDCTE